MAQRYKIAYCYPPEPEVYKIVRPLVPDEFELIWVNAGDEKAIGEALVDADFLVGVKATAAQLSAARKLKVVQLQGVGYDGVNKEAQAVLKARGIPMCMTVPGTIGGVAEHTILLILALYKHLLEADHALREGRWLSSSLRTRCYLFEGKTLGIVGLGRIGQAVAKKARGFEPVMVYYDIIRQKPEVEQQLGVTYLPLDDLLCTADIVTVHVPLTPQTRKFLGAREFALMKPTAIFINTARGTVVDEPALYQALKERRIMGAGLDVFEVEPTPKDNPLLQLDNVIVTPHMATGTRDSLAQKAIAQFENFQRYLRGEPLMDVIEL